MNKGTSLILGCGGQDGQSLCDYLLPLGRRVVGMVRRSSQPRRYLQPLIDKGLELVEGDLTDISSLSSIFKKYQPEHIYAIGAQSHVATSFESPLSTFDITGKGILNVLEAMRSVCPDARMYNAASSEMFGSNYSMIALFENTFPHQKEFNCKITKPDSFGNNYDFEGKPFQNEDTPLRPQSPYGVAKLAAYHFTRLYREAYNLFSCSGILFNHEGKYRSLTFVTRKITNYVSRLYESKMLFRPIEKLKLGNIDACRDWMDARDAVRAMVLMLEADTPDDYVVGTGLTWSVRDFLDEAFSNIGEDYRNHIEIDPNLFRPAEVDYLRAKPDKIYSALGWKPNISFRQMVRDMVSHDLARTERIYKNYGNI